MGFIKNPEKFRKIEALREKNTISQDQLLDAKLYSDRVTFIDALPKNISFLEVGVLGGDFAIEVIEKTSANKAVLVDPYLWEDDFARQYKIKRWDGAKDHYKFVKNRFTDIPNVEIYAGTFNFFCINRSDTFDFIYIDYIHTVETTNYAIQQSILRLNPGGILGFNDYTRFANPGLEDTQLSEMGVIDSVNYFLKNNKDWYVYAFALNEVMCSDIYLKKRQ